MVLFCTDLEQASSSAISVSPQTQSPYQSVYLPLGPGTEEVLLTELLRLPCVFIGRGHRFSMLLDLLPHVRNLLLGVPLLAIHMRLMNLRTTALILLDAKVGRLVRVDHLRSTHAQEACGDRTHSAPLMHDL